MEDTPSPLVLILKAKELAAIFNQKKFLRDIAHFLSYRTSKLVDFSLLIYRIMELTLENVYTPSRVSLCFGFSVLSNNMQRESAHI